MRYILLCIMVLIIFGCKEKIATIEEVEADLKEFVIKVNNVKRSRDYQALVDLFITKDELIDLYAAYGYDRRFAKMKYAKNIVIPDKEYFEWIFKSRPGGYYDCPGDYVFRKEVEEGIVFPFSEILDSRRTFRKPEAEYYFCEEVFKMECSELTEGYSYKMTRDHKIGELCYIPGKGWRLTNGF